MSKAKSEAVRVRLACIYAGDGQTWSAGEVIEVDAAEAARLVDELGVATRFDNKAT